MAKQDHLFELIQSLSRSEKRYFKIMAGRESSGANYLVLFDAIAALDVYDEAAIKHTIRGTKMVAQLHVTKNYLRKLIFKSLRNFHSNLSKEAAVRDSLRNIEILYNKELFDLCRAELKLVEKVAQQHELHSALTDIYDWERKLRQLAKPQDYAGFRESLVNRLDAINRVRNSNDYLQLIGAVSDQLMSGSTAPILNESWLDDASNAQSTEALVMHYNANYFRLVRDAPERAGQLLYELLDKLEQRPDYLRENPSLYVSTINNFISYFVFQKKYEPALELIKRARETYEQFRLKSENRTLLKQVLRTYNIELEVFRSQRLFRQHPEHIDALEAFVTANTNKMPKEYLLSFWFQLANIRFMQGNMKSALAWVNQILQTRFETRIDIQLHTRMLNLMIHTEQQNLFVLRYFVDSARRFVRKIKQPEDWELAMLAFFSRIGKAPLLDYKDRFRELHAQLFPENSDPLISPNTLDYVDYREWVEGNL